MVNNGGEERGRGRARHGRWREGMVPVGEEGRREERESGGASLSDFLFFNMGPTSSN